MRCHHNSLVLMPREVLNYLRLWTTFIESTASKNGGNSTFLEASFNSVYSTDMKNWNLAFARFNSLSV